MKKVLSAVLIFTMLFLVSSCTKEEKPALVISGAEIGNEIYNFYYDRVQDRPTGYGLAESASKKQIREAAIQLCLQYVAINTSFSERGLSLSAADKASIADKVNNYMLRFSEHYESIGISRMTLTKIFTNEAYEDAIFESIFDQGTDDVSGENRIKEYFNTNFVSFRTVCSYFTNGEEKMTEQQKSDLISAFNSLKGSYAFEENPAEAFGAKVEEIGYSVTDSILLKKGSSGYPTGFFEKIYAQRIKSVEVYIYDECIFAVYKEDLSEIGDSVYANYRSSCIEDLYADEWQTIIDDYLQKFTVDEVYV